uniref:CCHC-type domain-containing protein n=1 Tax=Trichogramma kaykai TaxID=54128 RepID=A0ABD2WZS3_9HYME
MAWCFNRSPCNNNSSACHRRKISSIGNKQRQLRCLSHHQEEQQQQHQQLPQLQQQQHQQEEARVEVRPLSPVAGPSSRPENAAAPTRIRGENFGGLESVEFVPGLDPPRGTCFECHEPGHTRRQCRNPFDGVLCTNCGRRGVKVRHCPHCSRGWKKSQRNFHTKKAVQRKQLWKALGGGRH